MALRTTKMRTKRSFVFSSSGGLSTFLLPTNVLPVCAWLYVFSSILRFYFLNFVPEHTLHPFIPFFVLLPHPIHARSTTRLPSFYPLYDDYDEELILLSILLSWCIYYHPTPTKSVISSTTTYLFIILRRLYHTPSTATALPPLYLSKRKGEPNGNLVVKLNQ